MKKDVLKNFFNKTINYWRKLFIGIDVSRNYVIFGFLVIFLISSLFAYGSTLKKKRLEAIDSFISSNETVLLKNYLLLSLIHI